MAHKFAEIAFTETVRQVQTEMGSRGGYESMDKGPDFNHLFSQTEAEFISARDSFYMATISETGWPYVQHRGGPAGFVKVLDASTIGFADYAGNKQYVSTGNLRTDDRISLFFMDYPNRRRLKILGRVSVVASGDLETMAMLEDDHFRAPVERAFMIHIEAFDWNCPKYITPRYTETDVENIIAPLQTELEQLRGNSVPLEVPVEPSQKIPATIGNGPLTLEISAIRQEAMSIKSYELRHPEGQALPPVEAGSHIQVPVLMASGEVVWRFYSICSDSSQQSHYKIAVLDQPEGTGGSHTLHGQYQVGLKLACYRPSNYFTLQESKHKKGSKAVFIAGGIGITPITSMIKRAVSAGYDFDFHYAIRSHAAAAFLNELNTLGDRIHTYINTENQKLDLEALFKSAAPDTTHYLCGPVGMINAARSIAQKLGMAPDALVFETFEE